MPYGFARIIIIKVQTTTALRYAAFAVNSRDIHKVRKTPIYPHTVVGVSAFHSRYMYINCINNIGHVFAVMFLIVMML